MIKKISKNVTRQKRHLRIRKIVEGTAERPRFLFIVLIKQFMYKSLMMKNKHTYQCS
jgi:ribosomal protein L18